MSHLQGQGLQIASLMNARGSRANGRGWDGAQATTKYGVIIIRPLAVSIKDCCAGVAAEDGLGGTICQSGLNVRWNILCGRKDGRRNTKCWMAEHGIRKWKMWHGLCKSMSRADTLGELQDAIIKAAANQAVERGGPTARRRTDWMKKSDG